MSSQIRLQRICQHCGNEFTAQTTVTKFCGDYCAKRAYKLRKRAEKVAASNEETRQVIEKPIEELRAKEFLSIADACLLLGISRTSLWRAVKDGRLTIANIGKRKVLSRTAINRLFE